MAMKRMREHEEAETIREEGETNAGATTFTDLPESLQLRILSSLDHTRRAIRALLLVKSWGCSCSWTSIPVLNFNSFAFDRLYEFDRFVYKVLSLRASVKLEKLTFIRGTGTCRDKILRTVFDYAFSHGIRELEIKIGGKGGDWPFWLHASTDSLTSLRLESFKGNMGCSFLGPRSGLFKNLTNLHLQRAIITDLDPFSKFLVLDKLKLIHCALNISNGNVLNIHALRLSELTILNNTSHQGCELATPKLRFFEFRGINFPRLTTHQGGGLPLLETAVLDFHGFCRKNHQRIMFDDLRIMFNTLCNAKSLELFSSVVHLLSLFSDELVNRSPPFPYLKRLKLDFSRFYTQRSFEGQCKMWSEFMKLLLGVKAYLLHNSHDAHSDIIHPILKSICMHPNRSIQN